MILYLFIYWTIFFFQFGKYWKVLKILAESHFWLRVYVKRIVNQIFQATGLNIHLQLTYFYFFLSRSPDDRIKDKPAIVHKVERVYRRHDQDIRQLSLLQSQGIAVLQVCRGPRDVLCSQDQKSQRKVLRGQVKKQNKTLAVFIVNTKKQNKTKQENYTKIRSLLPVREKGQHTVRDLRVKYTE